MTDPIQAQFRDADICFVEQPFAQPLVLSSGVIREATQATARVRGRASEQEADGFGSI